MSTDNIVVVPTKEQLTSREINVKCTQDGCSKTFIHNGALKMHLIKSHKIVEVSLYVTMIHVCSVHQTIFNSIFAQYFVTNVLGNNARVVLTVNKDINTTEVSCWSISFAKLDVLIFNINRCHFARQWPVTKSVASIITTRHKFLQNSLCSHP